jgi:adenylate cyclase
MVPATGQFSNFLPIGFVDVTAAGVPTALLFKAVSAIELNGFLQSVSDQQTSFSFIVDCGDGLLVSASKGATLIQLSMVSYRRLSPQESQASQISRAGRALLEKYGSYESVPSSTMTLEFEDTYFVEVQHYHVMGTRWLIVSGVSRSSVMGSIDEANFQTIIFSCAVFVLCLVIALVLTHLLVRPLARMRSQMQEVDRSPVDELTSGSKPDPLTFFIEVRRLQDSFTALQDAVRTITMYIPSFVSSMVFSEADSSKYDGRSPAYVAKQSSVVPFKCEPVAGLSSGKAVVLYVRIDGAEDLCHITDNGQFSSIIHELCETLGFIVSECNGVVDQLSLDHLTVYWLLSGDDKADICVIREAMACLARCQVAVEALRLSWSNRRWPLVNCRFGMHVAEALIGSFGSKYRMTYGIAGDAVVVARQLASLCEICEVSSLVSFEGLGATSTIVDDLVFRHVCLIFLPHVREQLSLFTLLPDSVPLRDRIQLAATFKNALDLFYSRDFESSMLAFGRFQSMFKRYFESGDKLADYYLQMCDNAVENGVPEEWQGAFTVARGREEWQLL